MEERLPSTLKDQWGQLLAEGQPLTFRKGQTLFYEGHTPYGIYVMQSGKVRFVKGDTSCQEVHLVPSPKGRVIGVNHFLSETPFCCTCVALTDCQLIFISKTQLLPLISRP